VLVCHQWNSPEEWGRSISKLADLTDAQIHDLVQPAVAAITRRSAEGVQQELLNRVTAIRAAAEILTFWELTARDRQTFLLVILDEAEALSGLTEEMAGTGGTVQ
jgi:hypothetical protein